MNAKIDSNGYLHIERAGKMVGQGCAFGGSTPEVGLLRCGDWCPHFGEVDVGRALILNICHGTVLYFGTLTDERKPA
jgi:hypothetical protein